MANDKSYKIGRELLKSITVTNGSDAKNALSITALSSDYCKAAFLW